MRGTTLDGRVDRQTDTGKRAQSMVISLAPPPLGSAVRAAQGLRHCEERRAQHGATKSHPSLAGVAVSVPAVILDCVARWLCRRARNDECGEA
jgi:hypothetical protein